MIGPGHVAFFYRVYALDGMASKVPKRERRAVAVDETKPKLQGRDTFVWAVIDVDTKKLLAIYASYQRSHINTMVFVKRVLYTFTNRPVIHARGRWAVVSVGSGEVRVEGNGST